MERKALEKVQTMLSRTKKVPQTDAAGDQVYDRFGNEKWRDTSEHVTDANIIAKVKTEIDGLLDYSEPGLGLQPGALGRQQASLREIRHALDSTLDLQVNGYKSATEASAMMAKRAEAVKAGTEYLRGDVTAPSPAYHAGKYAELSPDEMIAYQKGSRGEIERLLGTRDNDLQALKSKLQGGEEGWGTQKIATVHGQPAADSLLASVERNQAFRATHHAVNQNSQTAQRLSAANSMKPEVNQAPLIAPGSTISGMVGTAAKRLGNAALGQLRPNPTRSFGEVAKVLTSQGTARDRAIANIISALDKRQGNSLAAEGFGKSGSLLAAIAAQGAARRRREQ